MFSRKQVTCGGTIISPNFVLSAAHCVGGVASDSAIYAGVFDLNILTNDKPSKEMIDRVQKRFIKKYYVPDHYKPRKSDEGDISLLEMEYALTLNKYIQPACLPSNRPRIVF
jgi:secreted trypsin-like serine protease